MPGEYRDERGLQRPIRSGPGSENQELWHYESPTRTSLARFEQELRERYGDSGSSQGYAALPSPHHQYPELPGMIDSASLAAYEKKEKRDKYKDVARKGVALVGAAALTAVVVIGGPAVYERTQQPDVSGAAAATQPQSPEKVVAPIEADDTTEESSLATAPETTAKAEPQPSTEPAPEAAVVPNSPEDKTDQPAPVAARGPMSVRVASLNILHSTTDGKRDWRQRLGRSVNNIINNSINVAGVQEARQNQQVLMRDTFKSDSYKTSNGGHYALVPNSVAKKEFTPNPVLYDDGKFQHTGTEYLDFRYFKGSWKKAVGVRLQDKDSGVEYFFFNTHDPADVGGEYDHLRAGNAERYVQQIKALKAKYGIPIVFVGDFNTPLKIKNGGRRENNNTLNNNKDNTVYCQLVESGAMELASDLIKGLSPEINKCDSTRDAAGRNSIDHIFTSGFNVKKYYVEKGGRKYNGSDVHPTVIADLVSSKTN